jgi:hypothetical protein
MTSMSRKALKGVQKALPQVRLCKDMLVLPPTEHILRGYQFERTPYKETFYLWRVVLPLYRFNSRVILNYSHRIPKGAYVHLSKEAPDQSAVEVTRIIADDIPKLALISEPRDFLDSVGWMIGNERPSFLFDLGVTYFLIGRSHEAVSTLGEIPAEIDKNISLYERGSEGFEHFNKMRRLAVQLAQDVRSNLVGAMQTIRDWERKNIAEFEVADTLAEAAQD